MTKKKKTGNWHVFFRKKKAGTTSLSNTTESCTSNRRSATTKGEELEESSNISLYDSVYNCPLSVWIDVTVDNNLQKLILSGNPSREQLEAAKDKIYREYMDISDDTEMKASSEAYFDFIRKRVIVLGLVMAIDLIANDKFSYSLQFLNNCGISAKEPENENQKADLIKSLELKLKNRQAKLQEAQTRYESLQKKGEKPTRKYYNKLIVILSTCEAIKMQIDAKKLLLSEFAEYLNMYNEYCEHIRAKQK